MRDTRKILLISGGLTVGGAGLVVAGAMLFEGQGESPLAIVLLCIGFAVAPLAACSFVGASVSGLRKESLEQGKGEIARWKLSPDEWAAFRKQDTQWINAGRLPNILHDGAYRDGEVIFAAKAVIADGGYHDLIPGGLIDLRDVAYLQGSPSVLEFSMRTQKSRGASGTGFGFERLVLRVPVAADDTREAIKVLAHFKSRIKPGVSIAMLNPRLTIRICLGIAVICAIAAIWGFSNRELGPYGVAPLVAAVVGVIAGAGSLLLAAIVAYRVREVKR